MSDSQLGDSNPPSRSDWWRPAVTLDGRPPARILLIGQRLSAWLFALGAVAVLLALAIDRWLGVVDPVDRVAQPVLIVMFAVLAVATKAAPGRVAIWQRIAALALSVYFLLNPVVWALPGSPAPDLTAIAGIAPWLLLGVLALYVAWPPVIALALGLAQAVVLPLPMLAHVLHDGFVAPDLSGPWAVLLGSAVATAAFSLTCFVLAQEIQRLLLHLAPSMDPRQQWVTVDDLAQRRIVAIDSARRLAQEASNAKSAFLANMSHEIRTPMNGVLGMADLLAKTPLDDQQKRYVDTIQRSGRLMMSLLNDILDLSKVEAGRIDLEARVFSLRPMLDACLTLVDPLARKKGLQPILEVAPDVPVIVKGDRVKLQQVINNLLANAVKFTDQGTIVVRVEPEPSLGPGGCRFTVRDTGIGIPASKLDAIFEPFVQVDASNRRKRGGSGLGLAIVRRLVEVMGGKIGVDSIPGHGTTFWFTVALAEVAQDGNDPPPWPDSSFDAGHEPPPAQRSYHVLLVDDNEVNVLYGQEILRQARHRVDVAIDGIQAVAASIRARHDVILMDCQLPGMDGFEATRRIRDHEARTGRRRTVIIALTASAQAEDHARCRAAGMDDLVLKPYSPEVLQETLHKHLQ